VRLQNLVPIPEGETLDEINEALLESLETMAARRKNVQGRTVAERFVEEQERFLGLPGVSFDPRLPARVQVRKDSTVRLGGATYSLPSDWTVGPAMAWVGAQDVRLEQGGKQVLLVRERRGRRRISYLHYLPQLARRPQAVRQVAPELTSEMGEPWQRLWGMLIEAHDQRHAGRIMAGLLEAVVRSDLGTVTTALEAVLTMRDTGGAGMADDGAHVPRMVQLTAVPEALVVYEVQAACASDYDHLLVGGRS